MIDWLTLKLPREQIPDHAHSVLQSKQSMIMCIDPSGEINWMRPDRKAIRSDSHQVMVEMVGDLLIYGSPARVGLKSIDNVFGSGDPLECAQRMLDFVCMVEKIDLPAANNWSCTRMDVTLNFDLGTIDNVLSALEMLRHVEGGRYQVRTTAETVYWSPRSAYRSGKAYSKGTHMRYLASRDRAFLTDDQLNACDRLLRLELKLARHFWKKQAIKPWHEYTQAELEIEHDKYFSALVGGVEVNEMTDFEELLKITAVRLGYKEGQGKQAALSWCCIRTDGYQYWRERCAKSTFYRHKKILFAAGLSYGDFAARNVVSIRKRRIVIEQPVCSWADLLKAA